MRRPRIRRRGCRRRRGLRGRRGAARTAARVRLYVCSIGTLVGVHGNPPARLRTTSSARRSNAASLRSNGVHGNPPARLRATSPARRSNAASLVSNREPLT